MRFIVDYIPTNFKDCPFYNNGNCFCGYECNNECFNNPKLKPPSSCNGLISAKEFIKNLRVETDGEHIYSNV